MVMDISPTALCPTCGLGAVLGRNALGKPGDCGQARRRLNDTKANESQGDDDCHLNACQFGLRCVTSHVAIGTKRTSACALHMSAFDPKRTYPFKGVDGACTLSRPLSWGEGNETQRQSGPYRPFNRDGRWRSLFAVPRVCMVLGDHPMAMGDHRALGDPRKTCPWIDLQSVGAERRTLFVGQIRPPEVERAADVRAGQAHLAFGAKAVPALAWAAEHVLIDLQAVGDERRTLLVLQLRPVEIRACRRCARRASSPCLRR